MARTKRCLCVDCKPAKEKTALELVMFANVSPSKNEPKNDPKNEPKIKKDHDEKEEKKLNAKLDSLRDEVKELESELGLLQKIGKKNSIIPEKKENTEAPHRLNDDKKGFPKWIFDQILAGKYLDMEMQILDPDCTIMSELIHGKTREQIKKYFDNNKGNGFASEKEGKIQVVNEVAGNHL